MRPLIVWTALFFALPAHAVRPEPSARADAGRFDAIMPYTGTGVKSPPLEARRAFDLFNLQHGGAWTLRTDPRTGEPVSLRGGRTRSYPGDPEAAARAFLEDARPFLKIAPERLHAARRQARYGMRHVWFDAEFGGIPVEHGRVGVHLTDRGEVFHVDMNFDPEPGVPLTPSVSEADALRVVAADLGAPTASSGGLVLLQAGGGMRLAWKFESYQASPRGLWRYYVDAHTGELLLRYNRLRFLCSGGATAGRVSAKVFDVDPFLTPLAERDMADLVVYVRSPDEAVTTDAGGCFSSAVDGRIFTQLQGPFARVSNFRAASAHFDNAGAQWAMDPTAAVSSPHPYPTNCPNASCPETTLSVSEPGGGNRVAKVLPFFTRFEVGDTGLRLSEGGLLDDDQLLVLDAAGSKLGAYQGNQGVTGGASFAGAAVVGNTYKLRLLSNEGGQSRFGYDVGFSSYLVIDTTLTNLNPSSFTWTSTMTFDGTRNEINLFYQINKMRDFLNGAVNDTGNGATQKAPIDGPVAAMSHFGPGLANAFYNPDTGMLYFGDGDGDCSRSDSLCETLDGDATVIHHEYTHYAVDQIFPIANFGQGGAISEAMADYFSGTSFSGGGIPGIASFFNRQVEARDSAYGPIRTMNPVNPGGPPSSPCPPGTLRQLCFFKFPGDWIGEIHDDGQMLGQALWQLRLNGTGASPSLQLGTDSFGARKADRLAWETLFFYPDSFVGYLEAMLTVADQLSASHGFTPADKTRVISAFALHGISTQAAGGGDVWEPSDGPTSAVDLTVNNPVEATIFPSGDADYYSLAAGPGPLRAVLELPKGPVEGVHFAYQMILLDSQLRRVAAGAAAYDVNPTASGFCQDFIDCFTNDSEAVLETVIPSAGVYYLFVGGGETDFFSTSAVRSTDTYRLSVDFTRTGVVGGSKVGATFDGDTVDFSVAISSYVAPLYAFSHARLRDHALVPLVNTETNSLGSFLTLVSSASTAAGVTGRVRLAPGFDARFPAVGNVHLEVFGVNRSSSVVSLGLSPSIPLTDNGKLNLKAFNNVFNPAKGEKATFRVDGGPGGAASLRLYTVDGLLVKTLFEGTLPGGKSSFDWRGVNLNGHRVASGVYLLRFELGGSVVVRKVVVVK